MKLYALCVQIGLSDKTAPNDASRQVRNVNMQLITIP
jgi:hypothetical protein